MSPIDGTERFSLFMKRGEIYVGHSCKLSPLTVQGLLVSLQYLPHEEIPETISGT